MQALTLKALHWVESEKAFCSPSKHVVWPRDDIMRAECPRGHKYEEILNPDLFVIRDIYDDLVNHNVENNWYFPCGCGLYGATKISRVLRYKWDKGSLIFLMNSYGNYDAWSGGLRCQGMRPVAIVSEVFAETSTEAHADYNGTLLAGMEYFKMPMGTFLNVIPYSVACQWMERSWKESEIGDYWGDRA